MRLKSIILTELIHDRLVAYEELERAMNKKSPINKQKDKVKFHLENIAKLNGMIAEWENVSQSQTIPQSEITTSKQENNE